MNHTPQIKRAIQFAARRHHGQLRITSSAEPLPYITHLFSVALLVAEDGADDDVVTAALLHDTLEDTTTTRREIVEQFNERVAVLVQAVTEVKEREGKSLSWSERKTDYLDRLRHISDEALLIALADKVDNVESRIQEYDNKSDGFHALWKQPNESYVWYYGEALRVAQERLPNHPLTKRFAEAHATQLNLIR